MMWVHFFLDIPTYTLICTPYDQFRSKSEIVLAEQNHKIQFRNGMKMHTHTHTFIIFERRKMNNTSLR